ncbi:MAG: DUF84 family protein [Promethearchaeota archaeon]
MVVRVLIASLNPVKIQATHEAFSSFFDNLDISNIGIISTENHLKSQPLGEEETYEASRWRVKFAQKNNSEFDYYVGIEGGVVLTPQNQPRIVVYSSIGNHNIIETIRGCEIPLPRKWYTRLTDSPQLELGDLVTEISGISNIKQKEGAVGFLTQNIVKRFDILKQSVMIALIPFLNPTFFETSMK